MDRFGLSGEEALQTWNGMDRFINLQHPKDMFEDFIRRLGDEEVELYKNLRSTLPWYWKGSAASSFFYIMYQDEHISGIAERLDCPKAYLQSILFRELVCYNWDDILADVLVMLGLREDSSTGKGQIKAVAAMNALEFNFSQDTPWYTPKELGLPDYFVLDYDDAESRKWLWNELRTNEEFNLILCGLCFMDAGNEAYNDWRTLLESDDPKEKQVNPNYVTWDWETYSRDDIKRHLARYNGEMSYGNACYEYYVLFHNYNSLPEDAMRYHSGGSRRIEPNEKVN